MKIYLLVSVIFSIFMALDTAIVTMNYKSEVFSYGMLSFAYLLIICSGIYSIAFAYLRLSKPGISGSARSLVLKRHTLGIIIFCSTNLYITVGFVYSIFKNS